MGSWLLAVAGLADWGGVAKGGSVAEALARWLVLYGAGSLDEH